MALELILKALLSCPEFVDSKEKNWDAVCKLVPGSTPQQCERQWEEIERTSFLPLGGGLAQRDYEQDSIMSAFVKSLLQTEHDGGYEGGFSDGGSDPTSVSPEMGSKQSEMEGDQDKVYTRSSSHSNGLDQNENTCQKTASTHSRKLSKSQGTSKDAQVQGPNMVIHVCDESKNLKQDFTCPRDLLIREMKYFAEYLSVDAQRWEEVDISVHCDVQIFDWLIRYVKRNLPLEKKTDEKPKPQLEPNNVISILISSDFLKMDSLVEECISYCHENMTAIVSTPCNMNCINDKLVTRIASFFTQNELDTIKDRKDKFKSKLFCKKIEELFKVGSSTGGGAASSLYRCAACKRLLTCSTQSKLRCVLSRMTVDHRGQILYAHLRDPTFDVNDYLLSVREQLRSWREVFWRIWGCINMLYCFRCKEYFPGTELGHCRYHMQQAEFGSEFGSKSVLGVFPCCNQTTLRFDPTGAITGCSVRDHRVTKNGMGFTFEAPETRLNPEQITKGTEHDKETRDEDTSPCSAGSSRAASRCHSALSVTGDTYNNAGLIEDIVSHREMICVPYQRLANTRPSEINVFNMEALAYGVATNLDQKFVDKPVETVIEKKQSESTTHLPPIRLKRHRGPQRTASIRKMKLPIKAEDCDMDEDEDEDEEETTTQKIVVQVKQKSKQGSAGKHGPMKSTKWDSQRSLRWNQDAQREEDMKRMNELMISLVKQRPQYSNQDRQALQDKQKPREFSGGIYSKLEHHFRQAMIAKYQSTAPQTTGGSRARKNPVKQS